MFHCDHFACVCVFKKLFVYRPRLIMSSTIIVKHEICLSPEMCERLQEVFSPVSLYFPNGLKNRSIWQHRDTGNYIAAWYRLAEMRTNFITAGGVDADHRSPFEMEQIFNAYLEEIMSTLRPEQRNRPVVRYLAHCALFLRFALSCSYRFKVQLFHLQLTEINLN